MSLGTLPKVNRQPIMSAWMIESIGDLIRQNLVEKSVASIVDILPDRLMISCYHVKSSWNMTIIALSFSIGFPKFQVQIESIKFGPRDVLDPSSVGPKN
jgi:hypothetical protein